MRCTFGYCGPEAEDTAFVAFPGRSCCQVRTVNRNIINGKGDFSALGTSTSRLANVALKYCGIHESSRDSTLGGNALPPFKCKPLSLERWAAGLAKWGRLTRPPRSHQRQRRRGCRH